MVRKGGYDTIYSPQGIWFISAEVRYAKAAGAIGLGGQSSLKGHPCSGGIL